MKVLVIDPRMAGISGDMFLGALVDLTGVSDPIYQVAQEIEQVLDYVHKIDIEIKDVRKRGLRAKQVEIKIDEHFHHVMASDVKENARKVCERIGLSERGSNLVQKVLDELVSSEVAAHGYDPSKAHFHEIGSADTLIDIIGVIYLMESTQLLDADIYSTPPALGGGYIDISHGLLPVPAPAVLEILKRHKYPVSSTPVKAELTTPTGAALLVNLAPKTTEFIPPMRIEGVGLGAGVQEFEKIPNMLRVILGSSDSPTWDKIVTLETHIDDVSGEIIGNLIDRVLEAGAIDIAVIPMTTKKNRPGNLVKVLTEFHDYPKIVDVLMRESGTLGVRIIETPRIVAKRYKKPVPLRIHGREFQVRVKVSIAPDGSIINMKPEYEDLKSIAREFGAPLREVMDLARKDILERRDEILKLVMSSPT